MIPVHGITIRPIDPRDSIEELTALLHRSYAPPDAMGLNYTAVDQSVSVTRSRIDEETCYVAVADEGRMCGTIVFHPSLAGTGASWLEQAGVAHFGQLAVEPNFQKQGLGARLMDIVEMRARETNAREIALDTAEPAAHLIALYSRRGYRFIEYAQWRGKTYRSVIMSKTL
jgi:GNAT superfamily N-acetyltransferase